MWIVFEKKKEIKKWGSLVRSDKSTNLLLDGAINV